MTEKEKERQEEGSLLSRWSRRKAEVLKAEAEEAPKESARESAAESAERAAAEEEAARQEEERRKAMIEALPDVETLGPGSDFKPFMQEGVPEQLKRLALRKLWSSNPFFNFRDGLNDYDLDYTNAATVVANLTTSYQVGKGMPAPEKKEKPPVAEEAPVEPQVAEGEPSDAEEAAPESGADESSAREQSEAASADAEEDDHEVVASREGEKREHKENKDPEVPSAALQRRWGVVQG